MLEVFKRYSPRLVAVLLAISLLSGIAQAARPKPFIIDTDVGVDDVIAILYLLQRPDIDIKAISIASTGNAHCLPALRNVRGVLKLMKHEDIPVDCGPAKPLAGDHHFPASILDESDTLAGAAKSLPQDNVTPQQKGVDLLIRTIQASKRPVTILAIGPLTNIALALRQTPEIKNHIQAIYIMGGAVNVPGNLNDVGVTMTNTTAEWNIYLDPLAASMVFNEDIPVILVPLDATNTVPVNMNFYRALKKNHRTPAAQFAYQLFSNNLKMLQANQWYFWDPLSAVIASDESIATYKTQSLRVALTPEIESGRTVIDHSLGQNIRVASNIDKQKFANLLIDTLNRP